MLAPRARSATPTSRAARRPRTPPPRRAGRRARRRPISAHGRRRGPHAAASAGVEVDDPVGERQQRRAVGDEDRRCGRGRAGGSRRTTSASVAPSRPAVGSSSTSSGASRRNARASARRWRSPADSPAPRSPSGSRGRRAEPRPRRRAARRRARARRPRASRPGGRGGRCRRSSPRTGADAAAPRRAARARPPGRTRAGPRRRRAPCPGSSPSSTRNSVVFPQPLGPVIATTSPGATSGPSTSIGAAGMSVRVPRAGSRRVEPRRGSASAAAAPSAPAW